MRVITMIPTFRFRAVHVFLLLALLVGCGANSTPTSDDDDGGGGAQATAQVELVVTSAKRRVHAAGKWPGEGRLFIVIQYTLTNVDSPSQLAPSMALFTLSTESGISYLAEPATVNLPDACPDNVLVNVGGAVSCGLIFNVPESAAPASLEYRGAPDPVVAPVTFEALSYCSATPETLGSPECSGCIQLGACENAFYELFVECTDEGNCVANCQNQSTDQCECADACATGSCATRRDAWIACIETQCTYECL